MTATSGETPAGGEDTSTERKASATSTSTNLKCFAPQVSWSSSPERMKAEFVNLDTHVLLFAVAGALRPTTSTPWSPSTSRATAANGRAAGIPTVAGSDLIVPWCAEDGAISNRRPPTANWTLQMTSRNIWT